MGDGGSWLVFPFWSGRDRSQRYLSPGVAGEGSLGEVRDWEGKKGVIPSTCIDFVISQALASA